MESQGSQIFWRQLEKIHSNIQCSPLTWHLWSHYQGIDLKEKEDLFNWCRENIKVEIVHKGSVILPMETADSKNCNLYMQERTNLLYDLDYIGRSKTWVIANQNCLVSVPVRRGLFGHVPFEVRMLMRLLVSQNQLDRELCAGTRLDDVLIEDRYFLSFLGFSFSWREGAYICTSC